jgi:hypothetical protein
VGIFGDCHCGCGCGCACHCCRGCCCCCVAAGAVAQVVEVARQQLAVTHHEARAARAQGQQRGEVHPLLRAAALADGFLQPGFDRREQFARQLAELFHHGPLQVFEQPQPFVVADEFESERMVAHGWYAL